jgi:hypothetical protein
MVWGIEPEIVGIVDDNPCEMDQLEDNPCGMGQPEDNPCGIGQPKDNPCGMGQLEELMNNGEEQTMDQVAVRRQLLQSRESHKCG